MFGKVLLAFRIAFFLLRISSSKFFDELALRWLPVERCCR